MLDFLYTVGVDVDDDDDEDRSLDDIIALYALGDKYAIPSLCEYASLDFENTIRDLADTPQRHSSPDIVLGCIPQLYTSTPDSDRTLKDLLVEEMIYRHCSSSSARPDVKALLVSSS